MENNQIHDYVQYQKDRAVSFAWAITKIVVGGFLIYCLATMPILESENQFPIFFAAGTSFLWLVSSSLGWLD